MRLQDRDIEIINCIEKIKGATINQIGKLFFKGSYESAKKRLKILENNKYIKGSIHSVLNKKVYYTNKIPSYHKIVANEVEIILSQNIEILEFKYEAKIDKYKVDALCVYKKTNVSILIIEIDIFNRTKDEKIKNIRNEIKDKIGIEPKIIIINLHSRRSKKNERVINININEIHKIVEYI